MLNNNYMLLNCTESAGVFIYILMLLISNCQPNGRNVTQTQS